MVVGRLNKSHLFAVEPLPQTSLWERFHRDGLWMIVSMHRLVIDTNVLISALVFKDSRHLRLREAWQAGRVTPLLSVRTYRELKLVLGYPMFKLEDDQIAAGLALLGPFIEWVQPDPERMADLPKCSDRDDQKFVEAAHCGHADALLTYDRALLKMRKRVSFDVLKPEVWMETAFA